MQMFSNTVFISCAAVDKTRFQLT